MSRAFVSEDAAAAQAAVLPERPVSQAPNLVTARGHAAIAAEVARLAGQHTALAAEDAARAAVDRDLRYWRARLATAVVVPALPPTPSEVSFGCLVTLQRGTGGTVTYRIVGEDEADPAHGLLGWTAPLAEALLGARAGEEVDVGSGRPPVTILRIEGG